MIRRLLLKLDDSPATELEYAKGKGYKFDPILWKKYPDKPAIRWIHGYVEYANDRQAIGGSGQFSGKNASGKPKKRGRLEIEKILDPSKWELINLQSTQYKLKQHPLDEKDVPLPDPQDESKKRRRRQHM